MAQTKGPGAPAGDGPAEKEGSRRGRFSWLTAAWATLYAVFTAYLVYVAYTVAYPPG